MKRLILSLVAIATISLSSFGQAPEGFKYQAVVRDAGNIILNNQSVGMQMTIQQGSIGGVTVYQETFAPTTNGYGLVNLEIGSGTTTDDFTTIDWSAGPYFIETAVDVTGGTSYAVMGTSQLMSVPYALYAKTSGNGAGPQGPAGATGPQGPIGNDGAIGATGPQGPIGNDGAVGSQGAQGLTGPAGADGIDGTNGSDGATGLTGPAGADGIDGTNGTDGATGLTGPAGADGIDGTNGVDGAIGATGPQGPAGNDGQGSVTQAGPEIAVSGTGTVGDPYIVSTSVYTIGLWPELGGYVFRVSADGRHGLVAETVDQSVFANWYTAQDIISDPAYHSTNGQKFMDWRMPTRYELNEMYVQKLSIGGFASSSYWSSTEADGTIAWLQDFSVGNQSNDFSKYYNYYVRSVRAF